MTANVTRNLLRDDTGWPTPPKTIADFHRRMPAYSPTLLLDAPDLAEKLGVGRLLMKAETRRMGLPSFKILGASWATYQAICAHIGHEPKPWRNINELAANLAYLKPFKLATATDGNHGRAVAFMARLLGFEAHVFVPAGMADARIQAMEKEGAAVSIVDGDYDDAIDASGLAHPDLVVVPMGVGAFMAAAVTHYRSGGREPIIAGVEPLDANCVQVSALAGDIAHVPGPHRSIMVGLNCGRPSLIAWPRLRSGVDWFVSVDDEAARDAMRDLAEAAVVSGETGGASLAGLRALVADAAAGAELADMTDRTVLVLVTEGATDPAAYEEIVGRGHDSVGRVLTAMR
jgi:diaminopropionate ammonia-lyase